MSESASKQASQRADGSLRKEVRVRKGYVPPAEDIQEELLRKKPRTEEQDEVDTNETKAEDVTTTSSSSITCWDEYLHAFGSSEIRKCRECTVHACSVGSNAVNEDSYAIGEENVFAVFDGHGGPECSRWMARHVISEFDKICPRNGTKKPKEKETEKQEMKKNLKTLFARLDDTYMSNYGAQNPFCGSCGLLCHVSGGSIWSANVGDSRAVVVRRAENGVLKAIRITSDQNTSCARECEKVCKRSGDFYAIRLHKDDELAQKADPTLDCKKRVAGTLMVTRALGDGFLKDPKLCPDSMKDNMPYITSKPQVRETVRGSSDSFLIIASDGVWDILDDNDVALEVMNAYKSSGDSKKDHSQPVETNLAVAVAKAVIQEMMTRRYVMLAELSQMKATERRHYIDDVTVLVVDLKS
ncbi:hypothetical protein GUITHDRAFT_104473 [Guillardia theta CCMP2712]|uniref:PPM-type phosphatase domain-containing protein n=1 Tax=Guillardia theta (strain CCMP2712) TaxID=905079 RepID=L1JPS9_GUITC|nr:hypothetical protein GUITHDRAFT_104473 [Guillardia theta CCMP2712]EKX50078.1 hypothetical protein GUITHDRAFT_104473 [Guillardia theta CCMP2712]|eukprot:XP_005837058.1 hypothetical protein GUITHDRAFT_104473 [Guillardia theta CCMP2712]